MSQNFFKLCSSPTTNHVFNSCVFLLQIKHYVASIYNTMPNYYASLVLSLTYYSVKTIYTCMQVLLLVMASAASSFSCSWVILTMILGCFTGCISSQIGLGSRLLARKGQTWVSDNGTFALGFTPAENDNRLFQVAIWFAKLPGDRTLVWSPNRYFFCHYSRCH